MINRLIILIGALVNCTIALIVMLATNHPEPITATAGIVLLWIGVAVRSNR